MEKNYSPKERQDQATDRAAKARSACLQMHPEVAEPGSGVLNITVVNGVLVDMGDITLPDLEHILTRGLNRS